MIATVLFIIGFVIIYLTRPKKKIVPFEGLNLGGWKSSANTYNLDEENELKFEPNKDEKPLDIELVNQQKENLHQVDPNLKTEEPDKTAVKYLDAIPNLQYVSLFKDENSTNNLAEHKETDSGHLITANPINAEDISKIHQSTPSIDEVKLQDNKLADIPESVDEPFVPKAVIVEEPVKSNEKLEIEHSNALVSVVELLLQLKVKPRIEGLYKSLEIGLENEVELEDDSIIDIKSQPLPINYAQQNETSVERELDVPQWAHCYIYSFSDLSRATAIQKEFYNHYKVQFLKDQYLDLGGNLNYIFILFYDLIEEYRQKHNDLNLLTRQFKKLEELCPKIRRYADIYLKSRADFDEGTQSGTPIVNINAITDPAKEGYQSWDWKNVYIKKLSLNKEDAKYLNDIWISNNTFLSIEQCCAEVLKLYIASVKLLKGIYAEKGTNVTEQFPIVCDLIARKQYRYHLNSPNYVYTITNGNHQLYMYILRYCENQIRNLYHHKRKISLDSYYSHTEVKQSLDERIIGPIAAHMPALLENVACPSQDTEIELNASNTTRWKNYIQLTEENYKLKGKDIFHDELTVLINLNAKNPSLESIYYELSKFLSAFEKLSALKFYLQYANKNKLAKSQPLKLLPKTAYKQLFHDQSQRESFEAIVIALVETSDLTKATAQIDEFYRPVRKKIELNLAEIKQVENQFSETVGILNEYLKEDEEESLKFKTNVDIETAIPAKAIYQTSISSDASTALYKVSLSSTEIGMLKLFKINNFTLQIIVLEDFCKRQGALTGPLINNINETCFDILDDRLIEQDESELSINPTYYNQIINE